MFFTRQTYECFSDHPRDAVGLVYTGIATVMFVAPFGSSAGEGFDPSVDRLVSTCRLECGGDRDPVLHTDDTTLLGRTYEVVTLMLEQLTDMPAEARAAATGQLAAIAHRLAGGAWDVCTPDGRWRFGPYRDPASARAAIESEGLVERWAELAGIADDEELPGESEDLLIAASLVADTATSGVR